MKRTEILGFTADWPWTRPNVIITSGRRNLQKKYRHFLPSANLSYYCAGWQDVPCMAFQVEALSWRIRKVPYGVQFKWWPIEKRKGSFTLSREKRRWKAICASKNLARMYFHWHHPRKAACGVVFAFAWCEWSLSPKRKWQAALLLSSSVLHNEPIRPEFDKIAWFLVGADFLWCGVQWSIEEIPLTFTKVLGLFISRWCVWFPIMTLCFYIWFVLGIMA